MTPLFSGVFDNLIRHIILLFYLSSNTIEAEQLIIINKFEDLVLLEFQQQPKQKILNNSLTTSNYNLNELYLTYC